MNSDSGKEFSTSQYWDDRYGKDDQDAKQYEWLRQFDSLRPFLSKHLPAAEKKPKILHLGNGNSVSFLNWDRLDQMANELHPVDPASGLALSPRLL